MLGNLLRKIVPASWRPIRYLENLTRSRVGSRVLAGPFAGMRYIRSSYFSAYIPKLLGSYEKELVAAVEAGCGLRPDAIIDVGAAEGYYAVGLALRNPSARVIAFEMEEDGRRALGEMRQLNSVVERVQILGRCEPPDLQAALTAASRSLVVCDVESYELALLDPVAVPALREAHILVELHDFLHRGLAETIEPRFTATHRVTRIWQQERAWQEFPFATLYTRLLPKSYLRWAVDEWRPERMSWFWMEPLAPIPTHPR